ncbi:MAG: hypothetical protein NVS2B16_02980 [Chloroflexota bacterium]
MKQEAQPERLEPGKQRRKTWVDQHSRFWVRLLTVLFTPVFRYWVRYFRWFDVEKVPSSGGIFLLSNHTTGMDPFLIGFSMRHRTLWGPGRIELFQQRIPAYIMRKIGMFPLRQGVADAAATRTVLNLYRAGQLVLVFPEGGRSGDGELQKFTPGVARLIIKLKAPIAPVAISGGTQLLPIGAYLPRRNTPVVAVYGDPFDLSEFYGQELTPELLDRACQIMYDRLAGLLARARAERARIAADNGIAL